MFVAHNTHKAIGSLLMAAINGKGIDFNTLFFQVFNVVFQKGRKDLFLIAGSFPFRMGYIQFSGVMLCCFWHDLVFAVGTGTFIDSGVFSFWRFYFDYLFFDRIK